MHDVAAYVGVSIATVSRALSGNRPMSQELRDQVLAAADKLGYRVNLLGRALRLRRTFSLGLVVPDLENPFFSALAQQLSRSFSKSNIDVFIYSADNDIKLELRAIQSFLGRQVDGLVLIPCHEIDSDLDSDRSRCHSVGSDRRRPSTRIPHPRGLPRDRLRRHRRFLPRPPSLDLGQAARRPDDQHHCGHSARGHSWSRRRSP